MEPFPITHHSKNSSPSLRRDSNAWVVRNMSAHSLYVYEFYQNTLLSQAHRANKIKQRKKKLKTELTELKSPVVSSHQVGLGMS